MTPILLRLPRFVRLTLLYLILLSGFWTVYLVQASFRPDDVPVPDLTRIAAQKPEVPQAPPPPPPREVRQIDGEPTLIIPVAGIISNDLEDSYFAPRSGGRKHRAIDILAPKGTPVVAVSNGVIQRLSKSPRGGISIYLRDAAFPYMYYYAHLDRYIDNLKEGQSIEQGRIIGYVGHTGNATANTPHLHFEVRKVLPSKSYSQGTPLNPHVLLRGRQAGVAAE